MKKINIGLLGLGNVGLGTYQTLEKNKELIRARSHTDLRIAKCLVRDMARDRGVPANLLTDDPDSLLTDPDISIVAEMMGGIEPATTYMMTAMKNGKHVVTANKAAVAANFDALVSCAAENNVEFRFEASVGGGIPILSSLTGPLLANRYEEILGIVNGTTNYILTQMSENGSDYEDVLRDAQAKGFAEADPAADVEGIDVANKLSILMALAFGKCVHPDHIPRQGITSIQTPDIDYAKEFGYAIKLLGWAKRVGNELYGNVEPVFVPEEHPLASVSNEFNAIYVTGNAVDDLMLYGKGAGPLPTGSAVMGDILDIAERIEQGLAPNKPSYLHYREDLRFAGGGESRYYIRLTALDKPGVLGNIAGALGRHDVGIATMIQQGGDNTREKVPLIFIVHNVERAVLEQALQELSTKEYVESIDNVIRVADYE